MLWLDCLQQIEDGKIKRLLGLFPPGSGKALALDTPIPTPEGWKCIGDLKTGDKVFDENGKTCNVTWVSPVWKERPCYKVTTDCGDTIIADQDHEWQVNLWSSKKKTRADDQRLKTTKELATVRRGSERIEGVRCKRPMVIHAKPLELPEADLEIDPYVLGVWLGDGTTIEPNITCGSKDIEWLLSELKRLGYETSPHLYAGNYSVRLLNVRHKFRALKLLGGNPSAGQWGNKHIPDVYFRASAGQRLSLLQGLIDTDGYIDPGGGVVFSNTNLGLVTGVAELARSLGVKASVRGPTHPTLNGVKCSPVWHVSFFHKEAARMPRKRNLCKDGTRTPHTYLNITPCERTDTICIEVDSPSHLYLAGESMTPTHNSIYSSVVFPTHFMGRFKRSSIILASYGSELPRKFGRRARSIIQQPLYQRIFGTTLSEDSKAADEWALTNGSEWMAAGILTGITGNRADGVVWDDLLKGREQADSPVVRNKTWEAYVDDLLTRKKPKAFEIGISCLAGDTPITMGDGTRKCIRDIRKGDVVGSFLNGKLRLQRVLNWKNQGPDRVYEIKTGGSTVRANARHPFLVARTQVQKDPTSKAKRQVYYPFNGNEHLEWVRVKDLKPGDKLITNSRIYGREKGFLDENEAWLLGYMFGDGWITVRDTTQKGYKGHIYPRKGFVTSVAMSDDVEENDHVADLFKKIFNVTLKRTKFQQQVTEIARIGRWFTQHGLVGKAKTKRLPAFIFSEPEAIRVAFLEGYCAADGHKNKRGDWQLSSCNVPLLEDMKQLARGVGFRVRNVHSRQSRMQAPNSPKPTYSTSAGLHFGKERVSSEFIIREISTIKEAGVEDVFDIEVDGSENFFADGLVSHNTRWHEDDVPGRILPENYAGQSGWVHCRDGNDWYVVCLPAVCERTDDPLGRAVGDILWPEWFNEEMFAPFKRVPRTWSSLYQQRPAPDTGLLFESAWLKSYERDDKTGYPRDFEPGDLNVYGASDYAVSDEKENYTVHIVVGVDHKQNLYVLDLWRKQATSDKWIEAFCDLVKKWKPLGWAEETGQIKSAIGPFLNKRMRERQAWVSRAGFPSTKSKRMRAQSIIGRMAQNGLYCPFAADWFSEFRKELLVFDAGQNDDQVDALSLIGQVLDKMIPADKSTSEPVREKIFSTHPGQCTVTLEDMFEANEQRHTKTGSLRIQ